MKKYFIENKLGELEAVTKEEFDAACVKAWKATKPFLGKELVVYPPIIYGTGGEIPNDNLESIFYCPNNED